MITHEDITGIVESGEYPHPRERDLWWAERGVDHAGVEQFSVEDAMDTMTNTVPLVLRELGGPTIEDNGIEGVVFPVEHLVPLILSIAAMHTETGFLLGWLAHERHNAQGKPVPPVEL